MTWEINKEHKTKSGDIDSATRVRRQLSEKAMQNPPNAVAEDSLKQ